MAHALVDRPRHLAALGVGHGNIHVAGGDRRGDGLEAIGDRENDVGAKILELRRQLDHGQAGGLRHGGGRLALDDAVDGRAGLKPVATDQVDDLAEPVQQRRGAGDELELEPRMRLDRLEDRLDAPIIGAAVHDDADFSPSATTTLHGCLPSTEFGRG